VEEEKVNGPTHRQKLKSRCHSPHGAWAVCPASMNGPRPGRIFVGIDSDGFFGAFKNSSKSGAIPCAVFSRKAGEFKLLTLFDGSQYMVNRKYSCRFHAVY
jgi:hypothetical protein